MQARLVIQRRRQDLARLGQEPETPLRRLSFDPCRLLTHELEAFGFGTSAQNRSAQRASGGFEDLDRARRPDALFRAIVEADESPPRRSGEDGHHHHRPHALGSERHLLVGRKAAQRAFDDATRLQDRLPAAEPQTLQVGSARGQVSTRGDAGCGPLVRARLASFRSVGTQGHDVHAADTRGSAKLAEHVIDAQLPLGCGQQLFGCECDRLEDRVAPMQRVGPLLGLACQAYYRGARAGVAHRDSHGIGEADE